ncbi:uncharacterized protein CPUR_06396 [Claviceps purpurea 20.1]|uniref:Uncharacterized protein n=1 Tax=Claviceps purpurea (strain 20.1) TaxID=1111077 RepID=M1W3A4_CLAP2|nr:uncharacterized protein CPUR_06396 [Claviceps purpurea 20.1]
MNMGIQPMLYDLQGLRTKCDIARMSGFHI